ncbi:polymer-forming cytoskeletal protein [Paenibacillus dakarensis]|uniref:polymer-forming cytoskeletal protein n=1 Tax=Paenibacillus dakarensis TaxID=1527293 RepID=UPI0006D58B63|nr:polymer-forming cytoskeletal protein [Paenibacillus dakarensis]
MEDQKRHDLHMSGFGKSAGGKYGKVQLDGMGTIGGDLDCHDFIGNGNVSVKGSLTAGKVRIHGNGTIDGPVDAMEVHVGGAAKVKGALRSRTLAVMGRCNVLGQVTALKIEIGGSLKAAHVQGEKIETKGHFSVDGIMEAETMDIHLLDRCEAQEIRGDFIKVRKKGSRFWEQLSISFRPMRLFVRFLNGGIVDVEHTEAEVISGNRVILGPGCKVRVVEYREEFIQDPSAEVGEVRRI